MIHHLRFRPGWIAFDIARTAAPLLVATVAVACYATKAAHVSRTEFGDAWPLTVDEGTLRCHRQTIIFQAPDGTEYAINGTALVAGYQEITPIWADDPSPPPPKRDLSPLHDLGLELCYQTLPPVPSRAD
jgi:hypothetical protein